MGKENNFAIMSYSMLNTIHLPKFRIAAYNQHVFDHIFLKKHRPKAKFICFMDIYLLKGTFLKNCILFSEQHFSRRKRALCHRRERTFCVFRKLEGLGPLAPPGSYAPGQGITPLLSASYSSAVYIVIRPVYIYSLNNL
jgi:hypothetical protein